MSPRKCEGCGREFDPAGTRRKFCSIWCRLASGRPQGVYRSCGHCGRLFRVTRRRRLYCCPACQRAAALAKRPDRQRRVKCPVCGKKFARTLKRRVYCSAICQAKAAIIRAKGKAGRSPKTRGREYQGVCAFCGKAFESGVRARYCSQECRAQAMAARDGAREGARERVCKCCGAVFVSDSPNRLYCSAICARRGARGKRARVCAGCGATFYPSDPGAAFCSLQCKIVNGLASGAAAAICPQCGKMFTAIPGKIYCGTACGRRARKAARKAANMEAANEV